MKIILIGAGKLGKQLYRAFVNKPEIELIQWYDRSALSEESPEGIPITNTLSEIRHADIYLLCISDDAIPEVAKKLPSSCFVVHTAGSVQMNILPQNRKGVFYPLQSFSENQEVDFSSIPFGVEATKKRDVELLNRLTHLVGGKPQDLSSEQREVLHLAAVLVNNFTNHLLTHAAELCESQDYSIELLRPLLTETIKKAVLITPKKAQTGPALRNDKKTIKRHLELIESPELKNIYKTLTNSIQKFHGNEKL